MMLRNKNANRKVVIRSNKPKFIRAHSGEFNFYIDENRNQVSKHKNRSEFVACHEIIKMVIFIEN